MLIEIYCELAYLSLSDASGSSSSSSKWWERGATLSSFDSKQILPWKRAPREGPRRRDRRAARSLLDIDHILDLHALTPDLVPTFHPHLDVILFHPHH